MKKGNSVARVTLIFPHSTYKMRLSHHELPHAVVTFPPADFCRTDQMNAATFLFVCVLNRQIG